MNQLVLIALRRPHTFVVVSILIVLFGVFTILHMPTDVFPNITVPVTSVVWVYNGLLPQQVEGRITYLFERFLTATVEGIKYIHSHSYYGSSITNIYLQDGVDPGRAEADIVGIAQNVVNALPPDISPPMVMRLAPSSIPVAMLEVSADTMTPAELYNVAYMRIRPLLVTVNGAILPHPYGGQDMQVMVNLDQQKLLARHLAPTDVHDVLMKQYRVLPSGDIKIKSIDWIVQTNASPLKIEDFENIPIKREDNAYVYLRDVATVRLMGRVQQNAVLVKGKQKVIIVVMKSTEASTLAVVEGIKQMIPRAEQIVPQGVKIRLLDDASTFVKDAIRDVVHEMLTAVALVGLIVLLLLGSWRATVIVWTSIPLSILTAIIGLHWLGETINIMTLGGLALAVGILVDNATVMIENMDRHLETGKPLQTAIIDAATQIVVPTLVATLCITVAWLPLFQLTGVSGYLFRPMAEAIIIAMLASFILSYTLVPTMAKYMMQTSHDEAASPAAIDQRLELVAPPRLPRGGSVLVVDDDTSRAETVQASLVNRGYRVRTATTAAMALMRVDENPPEVIVVDLHMPGVSGVQLIRELRGRHYPGAIIALTGSADEKLPLDALDLGSVEVIEKPVDLDRLALSVEVGLNPSRPSSPA